MTDGRGAEEIESMCGMSDKKQTSWCDVKLAIEKQKRTLKAALKEEKEESYTEKDGEGVTGEGREEVS